MQRLSPQRYAVCLSLGLSFLSSESAAQSTDASKALFEQAFAQRRKAAVQQIALPTTLDGREIGIVDAQLRADGVWLSREVVMRLLKDLLRPPIYASLGSAEPVGPWVSASTLNALGIEAEYAAQSITLNLAVPLSLRLTRVLKVDNRNVVEPSNKDQIILAPERWSLIANSRWVMTQTSSESNAQNTARVYLDGAQRMGNWVLEAAGSLALNADSGVKSRDMTRLVRDWPTHAIRMSVGDLNTVPRSGLPAVSLGGIQLTRRFNLNPALSAQSQPTGRLELPRGAAIDVNVNGFLTRTLQLGPGVYELKDIPVFSGANEVELRIVEPGGRTSTQRFDYFFDAALLAPGLTEFDIALGKPSQVKEGGLTYRQSETVAALSWRQGLSAGTTVGASTQSRNTANGTVHVVQADGLWATGAGTVLASTIRNRHPQFSGHSSTFQWRWQSATQREEAPNRWSWAAAIQATQNTRSFATLLSDNPSPASRDIGMRLSALVPGGLSATLSAAKRTGDNAASNAQTVGLSLRRALGRL